MTLAFAAARRRPVSPDAQGANRFRPANMLPTARQQRLEPRGAGPAFDPRVGEHAPTMRASDPEAPPTRLSGVVTLPGSEPTYARIELSHHVEPTVRAGSPGRPRPSRWRCVKHPWDSRSNEACLMKQLEAIERFWRHGVTQNGGLNTRLMATSRRRRARAAFQQSSADHMLDQIDKLREAESRRAHAAPSASGSWFSTRRSR